MAHGQGCLEMPNEDMFVGEWENDMANGTGKYIIKGHGILEG